MHVKVANVPAGVAHVPHELVRSARLFAVFPLDLDVDQLRVDAHVEVGQVIVLDEGESVEAAGSNNIAENGLPTARLAAKFFSRPVKSRARISVGVGQIVRGGVRKGRTRAAGAVV